MGRTFVAQRGQTKSTEVRQFRNDRHTPDVRYTLQETVEIFIKAKEAEGLRNSTITLKVIMILFDISGIG
jgi:hypothetical protein